jgi:hypothetical protein
MTYEDAKNLRNGDRIVITGKKLLKRGREGTVTDARFPSTIYVILDGEEYEGWLDPKEIEKIN